MKNPSLLSLVVVLLAVSSFPPAAAVMTRLVTVGASPEVECGGGGIYTANSTYEANRRRLVGLLLAEAAALGLPYYTDLAVGYWPNRPQAIMYGDSCAASIAGALLEIERACPYHKEASFYSGNCTLEFGEFRIFGATSSIFNEGSILEQVVASGLIFQAIGFAWLFFLLLQEWRSRKRRNMVHSSSLLSGD
ncbi:unnamed protein product [Urochloa humidicola]